VTLHKRISATLAVVVIGVVCALGISSNASAYPHGWSCTAAAYSQCYDYSGTYYNPWRGVAADIADNVRPGVCAKGITAAGNIRSGSGCSPNPAHSWRACFSGGTPETLAYVYWGGSGGSIYIAGRARTERCPASVYD
jgi:hypothetical protein